MEDRLAIGQDRADHIQSDKAVHETHKENREPLDLHLPVLVEPDAQVRVEQEVGSQHLEKVVADHHRKEKDQPELVDS